jgi:hypothetical protein
MSPRRLVRGLACGAVLAFVPAASAGASVVEHGYLPLKDVTMLNYTLTLPKPDGRFPVVVEYGPYAEGVTSDPTWNDSGYAMLGVNMRGTGCSHGTFHMVRADIWGADGGEVVYWAARQPWSDGNIGMLGFSFTGTSQIATAAYAGPANPDCAWVTPRRRGRGVARRRGVHRLAAVCAAQVDVADLAACVVAVEDGRAYLPGEPLVGPAHRGIAARPRATPPAPPPGW